MAKFGLKRGIHLKLILAGLLGKARACNPQDCFADKICMALVIIYGLPDESFSPFIESVSTTCLPLKLCH
jgi:hypothetical protein